MKEKLKALYLNFALTIIFFLGTILPHKLYCMLRLSGVDSIKLEKYFALFVLLFIFSFIKQKLWRFLSMGMILYLSFFQFVHLEFYGLPVFPAEIYLFFTQFGEITGTLAEDYTIFILPIILVGIPVGICLFANKKIETRVNNKYMFLLFVFYIVYNPARTYFTGNTWGRQPSAEEFEGANIYLASSYFLGRILPAKLSQPSKAVQEQFIINFEQGEIQDRNIIFILGESLSPNRMSLFGQKRETTPFLESLKDNPRFFFRRAYSAGVSSDVSVAFLMNHTFGDQGAQDVFRGRKCLFSQAQSSGFKTYFYSSQSEQQLRYIKNSICPKFIESYKSLDIISPRIKDSNAASDNILIENLKKINLEAIGSKFIVLHQRGSHSPYNKRFFERSNKFKHTSDASRAVKQTDYYDNSVVEFDFFMRDLIFYIKTLNKETYIVYVSDHGETVGEKGFFGHAKLNIESYIVPFMIYSNRDFEVDFPNKITHLNVSLFLAELMGLRPSTPSSTQIENYVIYGNDIDGFMGKVELDLK